MLHSLVDSAYAKSAKKVREKFAQVKNSIYLCTAFERKCVFKNDTNKRKFG